MWGLWQLSHVFCQCECSASELSLFNRTCDALFTTEHAESSVLLLHKVIARYVRVSCESWEYAHEKLRNAELQYYLNVCVLHKLVEILYCIHTQFALFAWLLSS